MCSELQKDRDLFCGQLYAEQGQFFVDVVLLLRDPELVFVEVDALHIHLLALPRALAERFNGDVDEAGDLVT